MKTSSVDMRAFRPPKQQLVFVAVVGHDDRGPAIALSGGQSTVRLFRPCGSTAIRDRAIVQVEVTLERVSVVHVYGVDVGVEKWIMATETRR